MPSRLMSVLARALPPASLRGRHGRGGALPPRAVHRRPGALRRRRPRKRRAAPAWSSAPSTASRRTAARPAASACSTSCSRTCASPGGGCARPRASPLTALATLALCIGANLAIFAVVDSVLLRPLPFPDPDRLVRVFNTYPKAGVPDDGCSVTNYYERRGNIAAFESLAAYREGTADRRRGRGHGARARHAGVPGVLRHPGTRPRPGPRVHRRGDDLRDGRRGHPHGRLLAAAPGRRPGRDRPDDPRGRRSPDRGRRAGPGLPLPFLDGPALLPLLVEPRGPPAGAAALGKLVADDRADEARHDPRRGPGAGRRAQRREGGGRRSRGEDDGRGRLPHPRGAAPRRPRRVDSAHPAPRAGRRACACSSSAPSTSRTCCSSAPAAGSRSSRSARRSARADVTS